MSTKPSRTSKLIQAAALAAILVPLGSVAAEATSIDRTFSGGTQDNIFDFHPFGGNYSFELFFEDPSGPEFNVRVTDNITTQDDLTEEGRLNKPAVQGYVCVPIANGDDSCVDFAVTRVVNGVEEALLPGDDTFAIGSFYSVTIRWDAVTDFDFPNDPGNRIRIIHNRGDQPGDGYDTDITTEGSYQGSLLELSFDDPAIGGRDDNFQSLLVAQRPLTTDAVPEPATLFLVTTGVGGLLYRRRRKNQDSEGR